MAINYGDEVQAFFAIQNVNKPGFYVTETLMAKVIGFSHPNLAKRDWGWRGDILVEASDGRKTWNKIA